ncbi:kinase superfamily with octicosapeptide/Phox/Bem1p domain-containing protein [Perilla frutescens var. frutescens]|nr:kinase superfamily with octicosapeptide/Phox/Bem1p domain-containing protein [Perilla frutescens var. frutescens]
MAYDQNSIPKDLRPLNIMRNVPEDPRISPATSSGRPVEGYYASPPTDGSPGTMPAVYYPATIPESGYVPVAFNSAITGVAGWVQQIVPPQLQQGVVGGTVVNPASVYTTSPNYYGTRSGCSASDHTSDEGVDNSVSGRKVKFLCSIGGKILPRLSDGALRYVGGQTRIITLRRDVSFGEFVQKMTDSYVQNVVIKYQLPDEDLDALVSVSCPDDLENMMDEYEKMAERSSDGSAKLRIFLFSPSDLESPGHIGDLQDGGQRYVEAVNGIGDGFISGDCIVRKESIESSVSAQNSDISGTEGGDSLSHGLGEVTSLPSTGGYSPNGNVVPFDTAPRMVYVDSNPVPYADSCAAPLSIPMVKTSPTASLGTVSEQEVERSVSLSVPQASAVMSYPASSSYMQAYGDPHQETLNHANYMQLSPQMGFPTQILGTVRPVFTQQSIAAGASPQQFTPAVHMTMNPSFISMRSNVVPAVGQPQQVRVENYPADSMMSQRVVQLPATQGYNVNHAQVPATAQGGVYNWHQIPHPEHVALSEGSLTPQPAVLPERITRMDDCMMCQKALPHAHSDTAAQEQKGSPSSTISDVKSIYCSLPLDGRGRPITRPVVTGTVAESNMEQLAGGAWPRVVGNEDHESGKIQAEAIGVSQNIEGQNIYDRTTLHKAENPEPSKVGIPQGVMRTSGVQLPYGMFMANTPQPSQASVVQNLVVQSQLQAIPEATFNRPLNNDFAPVGMHLQKDLAGRESPKEYSPKVTTGCPVDDSTSLAYDNLRQIDGRLDNLRINPSEVLYNNEHNKTIADPRKEDSLHYRPYHIPVGEALITHSFPPTEPYEVMPTPVVGNPNLYPYSAVGANHLPSEDAAGCSVSCVETTRAAERMLPINEWNDNLVWSQPRTSGDRDAAYEGSGVSASYGVGDVLDNSTSQFINQDPWNMRPDTHYPPPRPSKIQIKRENAGLRDPLGDNRLFSSGETLTGNCRDSVLETPLDDGAYQPSNNVNLELSPNHSLSNKGSAEEQIKRELQAVAEGVAASVFHSSVPSNPDVSVYPRNDSPPISQQGQPANVETQQRDKFDEIKTKLSEKINLGFPASGMGRLQIIKNSDLEELRELGSGTFGTVYHGKWRGTDVAIKRINDRCFAGKPSEQERMRDDFWNEAIKLADLHHPNVVAFYGVVLDGPDGSVATVTEYMVNGSLRNALQRNDRMLDKRKRLLIGMDVAFGMEYLHGKNIVHFDLKSDNLLVNLRDPHRPICKVGDLGLSKVKCQTLISGGVRGTLPWMAPELLNGSSSLVSEKVDVFSFGIVMWELLTGEEPYADLHYGAIIGGIVSNTLRPPVPESCDPDWTALMERCWSSEPPERPNFTEIADELRAMANKLPSKGQVANPQAKS